MKAATCGGTSTCQVQLLTTQPFAPCVTLSHPTGICSRVIARTGQFASFADHDLIGDGRDGGGIGGGVRFGGQFTCRLMERVEAGQSDGQGG